MSKIYSKENFFVVVPFYNEEKLILSTLDTLNNQSDTEFTAILVNNNSTDKSAEIINNFIANNPKTTFKLIHETQKGTGAAADTGFRKAIELGAKIVARTDADAIPAENWIETIKKHFSNGKLLVGGKLKPRKDEVHYRWYDSYILPVLVWVAEVAARVIYNGKGYNYPMFMLAGLNMAVDSELYLKSGGFPRSSIDDIDEDKELHLKIRKIITKDQALFAKDMIVYGSTRKARAFGYIGILLWYWDRKYKPKVIDVR